MHLEAATVKTPTESRFGAFFHRIREFLHEWALACVVSALILPNMIAIATVALYLTRQVGAHGDAFNRTPARVLIFGVVAALAFCVLLAGVALRRFTRASGACPDVFADLRREYDHVTGRLERDHDAGVADRAWVWEEASDYCSHLDDVFARPSLAGLRWLLASGYLDASRRLHAAERVLMLLDPDELIVSGALNDEMRLQGSAIPQSSVLQNRLRRAVGIISATASGYFIEAPPPPSPGMPDPSHADHCASKSEALAVLAQVRGSIDEFRDSSREGLVRARNRLFAIVLVEGITGCVLLGLSIMSGASQKSIAAGSVFFIVGGVVGLFRQLQMTNTGENIDQDDYGLGIVRLLQTPLVSGIAGVGGVVLVKLSAGLESSNPLPLQDFLYQAFTVNPYGLVTAAVFGLAPSLLLSGLQQRVDKYKSDLASSGAGQSSQPGT
jgi:hypothetical protein